MFAASAVRIGSFVAANIGGELLFYQLRRRALVDQSHGKRVVGSKWSGQPGGVNGERFGPPLGHHHRRERVAYVVFTAFLEVGQVDAVYVIAGGCVKNAYTQRRDLSRCGCIIDVCNSDSQLGSVRRGHCCTARLPSRPNGFTTVVPQLLADDSDDVVTTLAPLSLKFAETLLCFSIPVSPAFGPRCLRHERRYCSGSATGMHPDQGASSGRHRLALRTLKETRPPAQSPRAPRVPATIARRAQTLTADTK